MLQNVQTHAEMNVSIHVMVRAAEASKHIYTNKYTIMEVDIWLNFL